MSFGFGFGFPRRAAAGGAAPSLNFDFTSLTSLPSRITFSRTSNATLTDSNGRVAYAPHNLLTNSEDFEASAWTKVNATVTANSSVAPDGTTTADKLIANTTLDQHRCDQTPTSTAAPQTFSVYVKAAEYGFVGLRLNLVGAIFNLSTGAVSGVSASITAQSVSVGNGWYRCSITKEVGVANDICRINISDGSAIAPNFAGNGTDGVFIWGAQLNVANAPVNLLTFSEQFDNAVWQKLAAGTAVAPVVTANYATAPDGTLTADRIVFDRGTGTTGSDISYINQSITSVPSDCTGSIWLRTTDGSTKSISFRVGNTFNYTANVTGTWTRFTLTGTAPITRVDLLAYGNASVQVTDLLVWGAQLNTGSTALPYVATTSSIYLPPSYNSTTPKNLLGFTQEFDNAAWTKSNSFVQTNLLTWSEQFDNAVWIKANTTITVNTSTAPDGATTADTLTASAGTTVKLIAATATTPASTASTFSVYAKAGTNGYIQLYNNGDVQAFANFDLLLGSVGTTGTKTTASITSMGNGWYRCAATFNSSTAFGTAFRIYMVASSTAIYGDTLSAAGTETVLLWGAQLVQGSVPGDYQVTTSAAAAVQYSDPNGTRTADKVVATATSGYHAVRQTFTYTTGTRYTLSVYARAAEYSNLYISDLSSATMACAFDLQAGTAGTPRPAPPFTSVVASIQNVGGGWYRCSLTGTSDRSATTTPTFVGYPAGATLDDNGASYTGDGTSGIYIWGAQLSNSASVDPYVYNPQAAPTSTAYYGPRFDYNPTTLAANGLLIEQQSTNLLLWSEDFSNAVWVNNGGTVTSNALVAPDGTTTADYLVRSAASGDGRYQAISAGTSGVLTASIYIKKDTAVNSAIWIYDATAVASRAFATITWSGSTPTLTATDGTAGIPVDAGNGWWRISITSTALVGANTNRFYLLPAYTASSNGQQTAFWGAQLE